MLRIVMSFVCWAGLAGSAAAQDPLCEQWWYARNLIFDRAGYCFASPLGQALFDNADCTTSDPQLPPEEAQLVEDIRFMEGEFDCAVDSSSTSLAFFDAALMEGWTPDVPIPAEYGSGCFGYHGPPIPL